MTLSDIRVAFLEFYKKQGHTVIPSFSLVPENDPTTLFTGSGMQPLLPYLLGQKHPAGERLADSQKCFRAEDIQEVGDNRHTTFFEMLGNWSLGSYFKEEQLTWMFSFLVDTLGLDPNKLYVTVFSGSLKNDIQKDEESILLWKKLFKRQEIEATNITFETEEQAYKEGMQGGRIFAYGTKKNWWSRAGKPENMPAGEPGGPDSEVFYDFGTEHNTAFGKECHPNCECGRFMEICNSVFMEYKKMEDGSFDKLSQRNVDFGGGLERITAACNNNADVFKIDALWNLIKAIEKLCGNSYEQGNKKAFRVIADHLRGVCFMIADGVLPSNTDRGYIARRLIRRAVRYANDIGIKQNSLSELAHIVIDSYAHSYGELRERQDIIIEVIAKEEQRFLTTLERGLKEFQKIKGNTISASQAFNLYQSYGFPLEMTIELAQEQGKPVDTQGFAIAFKKHQLRSRTATSKKFKGGLADHSQATIRLHTAHHLLLAALRKVLGENVRQRGSNITAERLRIDFSYPKKMTQEELKATEDLVNKAICNNLDMLRIELAKEEAIQLGAEMEFGAKYGDTVSVYIAQDKNGNAFSKEFCGGPHATTTGELGQFCIIKEEAISAGIRRIKAILKY